jgi:hypothetical protein
MQSYKAHLKRGIRTLKEIAHYVRCIPLIKDQESKVASENIWTPPNIMLMKKVGQECDHALLMASMFRAVTYEDQAYLNAAFIENQ